MMFAATAFVACNNDEMPTEGIDGGNGEDTWAAFSIQLPKTVGTRAADATNATNAETEVKTIALYIEQNGHLLTSGIKTIGDFATSAGDNVYKANIAIKAETGSANVWVAVNPTADMHTRIMGLPANEAFHTAFNATVADMAGGHSYATDGVTNTGFVMANKATKNVTLNKVEKEADAVNGGNISDDNNHFLIEVERAVAKVAVISKEATLASLNKLPEQGDFSDIRYYVAQVNEETFMARKTDAVKQPKGANIITPGNDHDGDGNGFFGTKVLNTTPLAINESTVTENALNSIYVLENSMLNPLEQNATHAVIVATWTPKKLYKADGVTEFTSYTTGGDFWFYNSRYYGELPAECVTGSDHADAGKGDTYKWSEGKCYYRVYLYDKYAGDKFYDVVRNTVYNVNISSIKAPGSNTAVPPVGPTPIPEDVWVTANVDVLPWTSAAMDDVDLH